MAREKVKEAGGVSLEIEDMTTGLFGAGEARIAESVAENFKYGNQGAASTVWLVTYERAGEKYEQPYSVGNGWRVGPNGESFQPTTGQTGLSNACNASKYLIKPLRDLGVPKGFIGSNPRVLEGMTVLLERVAQERRNDDKADTKERTILMPVKIVAMPGESNGSTSKATRKVETKSKAKVEDDDEDEPKAKPTAKGKANKGSDDAKETAVEALVEALEKADGELEVDDIRAAIKKAVKGSAVAEDVLVLFGEDEIGEFLEEELGWTYNAKKGIVTLDK